MTPIIFIHQGAYNRPIQPLYVAIVQAKQYNAPENIFVLADKSCRDSLPPTGVNIIPLDSYTESTIGPNYIHLSPNPRDYELFCLNRWFALRNWMRVNQVQRVMHLDSDVMLYANSEEEDERLGRPDLMHNYSNAAHSFWSFQALDEFCQLIVDSYQSPQILYQHYESGKDNGSGVSDMTFIKMFSEVTHHKVIDSWYAMPPVYDGNINFGWGFRTNSWGKVIEFIDNRPHGVRIEDSHAKEIEPTITRFSALHFQGNSKDRMIDYLRSKPGAEDIDLILLQRLGEALSKQATLSELIRDQQGQIRNEEEKNEALSQSIANEVRSRKRILKTLCGLKQKVGKSVKEIESSRWFKLGSWLRVSRIKRTISNLKHAAVDDLTP